MNSDQLYYLVYLMHQSKKLVPPLHQIKRGQIPASFIDKIILNCELDNLMIDIQSNEPKYAYKISSVGYGVVDRYATLFGANQKFRLYDHINWLFSPFKRYILGTFNHVKISQPEEKKNFIFSILESIALHEDSNWWMQYLPKGVIVRQDLPPNILVGYSIQHYHSQGQRHVWETQRFTQREDFFLFSKEKLNLS